jgi:hypothetical protein
MSRTARLWKSVGPLTVGGLILFAVGSRAAEPPALSKQLNELGRQALEQGRTDEAKTFFRKALQLEPGNAEAKAALARVSKKIRRVALQDTPDEGADNANNAGQPAPAAPAAPADDAPAPAAEAPAPAAPVVPADTTPAPPVPGLDGVPGPGTPHRPQATLENVAAETRVREQQFRADISERLQAARTLVEQGQPESALTTLRLAQSVVRTASDIAEDVRKPLERQIEAQILSTVRSEERIVQERAESLRMEAAAEQRVRALDLVQRSQETVETMMTQFDALMAQGQYNVLYNGGTGDIVATTEPFGDARLLAQKARALQPGDEAPRAGMFVASTTGFLAQELSYEAIKEYRFMLSFQDVDRAAVPFPDTITIEYPDADTWRAISEKRIKRYGKAVDLLDRDPKTKTILSKLEDPITMAFANETPLEEVLKYIKNATTGVNDTGIPIYVDPVGLQEAEKTLASPVTLDLEGVPLKTTLRLLLKQLGLTYTVKDGLLTITNENAEDTPTEIRVYPVADLAIIPISLMGGGMGGMRGGMGGMGGGMMGGMGGGMGGMGMGGMGMGGGMGMMSFPPNDPDDVDSSPTGFEAKKNN